MRFLTWLRDEISALLPAVIYFCIAFNLIYFTIGLDLPPWETRYFTYTTITIAGLFAGKILFIANSFRIVNAFPHKPMIYNICWKLIFYDFFTWVLWLLESIARSYYKTKSLDSAWDKILKDVSSDAFWAGQMWILMVLLGYIMFSEFVRVLSKDKMKYLILGIKSHQ